MLRKTLCCAWDNRRYTKTLETRSTDDFSTLQRSTKHVDTRKALRDVLDRDSELVRELFPKRPEERRPLAREATQGGVVEVVQDLGEHGERVSDQNTLRHSGSV